MLATILSLLVFWIDWYWSKPFYISNINWLTWQNPCPFLIQIYWYWSKHLDFSYINQPVFTKKFFLALVIIAITGTCNTYEKQSLKSQYLWYLPDANTERSDVLRTLLKILWFFLYKSTHIGKNPLTLPI